MDIPDLDSALAGLTPQAEPAPAPEAAPPALPVAAVAPSATPEPTAAAPPAAVPDAAPAVEIPEAIRADYERYQKFAPLLDQFEKQGFPDAQAYEAAQRQQADQQQAEAFLSRTQDQLAQEVIGDPAITARIDAMEAEGQIPPELADELRLSARQAEFNIRLQAKTAEFSQEQEQARRAVALYQSDRDTVLKRDEFKVMVNGERMALPTKLVDAIAQQSRVQSQEQLQDAVRQTLSIIQPYIDSAVLQARASVAKQQGAQPQVPGSAASPAMGTPFNSRNIPTLGSALAALRPTSR